VMKPELGEGISWAKGHYDSIHGRIASNWKLDGETFRWMITVPPNTEATVYVPAKDAASVSESGRPANKAEGVKFLRMEKDRAVFEVTSGKYEFFAAPNPASRAAIPPGR
jgi:alpha-L-rhamnosidase